MQLDEEFARQLQASIEAEATNAGTARQNTSAQSKASSAGIQLEFDVGSRVQAKYAERWRNGTIAELWYHEDHWKPGRVEPYLVKLDQRVHKCDYLFVKTC